MKFIRVVFLLAVVGFIIFSSLGSRVSVDVVDLNKVLDAFEQTLSTLDDGDEGSTSDSLNDAPVEDKGKEHEFLTAFASNLNSAKVMNESVGVEFAESGSIKGFTDNDGDNIRGSGDKEVFTIDLDLERNRVVASDDAGHYRDHAYRPRFGIFTGYMLGSMMNRGNSYYSGARAAMKPNYAKKVMSPKSYHKSAVTKARSVAKSVRARSGSRGFSFGK